jgi:hypothetical protein
VRALREWQSRFLVDGEPSSRDWNTQEEYVLFVRRFPGKVPWLNTTKLVMGRDAYGLVPTRTIIPQRAATRFPAGEPSAPGPRETDNAQMEIGTE